MLGPDAGALRDVVSLSRENAKQAMG